MKFLLISSILLICLFNFIKTEEVNSIFQYKSNVTLDCSKYDDPEYYQTRDGNETQLTKDSSHVIIDDKKIILVDLRAEQIRESEYFCKSGGKKVATFKKLVAPYILKPDKPSQTVTEGGNVELKCSTLYGNEEGSELTWKWLKNGTEITSSENTTIESQGNDTTLIIKGVKNSDKGEYVCELKNQHGFHTETIKLRVKDALAALWPFLAIVAEVIVLCLIILIYEKKCSKKPNNNEEENEQAQNLMGKDNSDLKKRTTKA